MKLSVESQYVFEKVAHGVGRFGKKTMPWIILFSLFAVYGSYGLYRQVVDGHEVTGMRDHVVWGLFIVNFIFLIGISYAGAMIGALLHLFGFSWRRPIVRIAGLMAIASGIIGPIFILLCIGRLDRLHHLFIYSRLQSPIIWDVFAIITFLFGAILFVYLLAIGDFAVMRDAETIPMQSWKRKAYTFLALNFKNTDVQKHKLRMVRRLLAVILVPLVILVSSILSWIFGMTLRPGWHSTIFGPYFVLASLYSGTGMIIVIMWFLRVFRHVGEFLTDQLFRYMGYIMILFAGAYGYFTFSEYLTGWYVSEKWESHVLDKLLNYNEYGLWFMIANVVGILLPVFIVAIPKFRTTNLISLSAFIMLGCMWVKRYLIIVPTLETPLLPIQDTRPEVVHYTATWVEWSMTFGGIACFILIMIFLTRWVSVIPFYDSDKD